MKVYDSKTGEIHPDFASKTDSPRPAQRSYQEQVREDIHGGLKSCRVCKKSIAASAKTCPHCGVSKPGMGSFEHGIFAELCLKFVALLLDSRISPILPIAYAASQAGLNAHKPALPYCQRHGRGIAQ